MVQFITAITRTASVPPWVMSEPWQASIINPPYMLLWECDHELALYLNYDSKKLASNFNLLLLLFTELGL